MTVVTKPNLHQLLEQDAAALVRLLLANLGPNLRLPAGAILRAQGWDWAATTPSAPPLARLSARNLEVLAAYLVDHLSARLAAAGLEGTYSGDDVDRAMVALADVLGR